MRCINCIHYDVCGYHIDEETPDLTVNECPHGFKHKDQYIMLPAYIGQKVWNIRSIHDRIDNQWKVADYKVKECKISMLQQKADKSWKFRVSHGSYVSDYTLDEVGKTIFFSETEANEIRDEWLKELDICQD